jgi:hypothetical protein
MKRTLLLAMLLVIVQLPLSTSFALTPVEEKNVIINKSPTLERKTPSWFSPHVLENAPEGFDYRSSVLPFVEDRYIHDQYIVIPTLGLIAPVKFASSTDEKKFLEGKAVDINPYLEGGIMYYHGTSKV